jgi:hypothetical protein
MRVCVTRATVLATVSLISRLAIPARDRSPPFKSGAGLVGAACATVRAMAKQKTTLCLDEDVLRRTAASAASSGRDESEVVEDALRRYLGLEVEQVWSRNADNALDPDAALALASTELDAFRSERDTPAA